MPTVLGLMVTSVCPLYKSHKKTTANLQHMGSLTTVRLGKSCSGFHIEKDKKETQEERLGVINLP